MPKSYGGLWAQVVSFENLLSGYEEARRGKRYKPEVLEFGEQVEGRLFSIQESLLAGNWSPAQYKEFWVVHSLKRRLVQAPAFCDRVVHHALIRVTQPPMERKWIFDSYACRNGKGTHRSVFRVKDFLHRASRLWGKVYVLQIDVSKYFPSINHEILLGNLTRTFREKEILSLFDRVVTGRNNTGKGLPIGALTSQTLANHYLSEADHFIKECLEQKFYVRYMDDMIILDGSKDRLRSILADIDWFLQTQLRLELNPKTRIYPASEGVDFSGYRTWRTHILPRKRNIQAAKARFKSVSKLYSKGEMDFDAALARLASFIGYTKHCDCFKSAKSTVKYFILRRSCNENGNLPGSR